ncbi:hypothetical protein F4553_001043 [Allocatelliglobosispora scoriae]|uniref:Secreted protein n=1 Tax=Allocatelliglobosispora scoriae TaxID=643052 RepID=A0A841BH99_9ACTN|nr:hypothetical protein [Allocatelliglobosispora scoriae]MBB5867664.1 hypothetical protein [Allocatelliglobosispora scoriae]
MTTIQTLLVLIVVLAVVALGGWFLLRRRQLRQRFGPEYDRAVAESDSKLAAERELRERVSRHAELTLKELDADTRDRYADDWQEIQARFVEEPAASVKDADELVTRLIQEIGYPVGSYDDQLAHLSVEHSRTLSAYREAHEISARSERGEAATEDLRNAIIDYRQLVAELLGQDPVTTGHHAEGVTHDAR